MSIINLGIVYEPHPSELAELSFALSDVARQEPEKEKLQGYAGPNEVVQLLIDSATWQNALLSLALIFGGKFAASFAGELGKLAASEVWKKKQNYIETIKQKTAAPFLRIVDAIKALRAKDQTVTIAIKIPSSRRNAGLVLTSEDPAEIAWQIANVIRCAEKIKDVVMDPNSPRTSTRNPDMSIVIEVLENGDIKVCDVVISD